MLYIFGCKQQTLSSEKAIENTLLTQVDSFENLCKKMLIVAEDNVTDEKQLQRFFSKQD